MSDELVTGAEPGAAAVDEGVLDALRDSVGGDDAFVVDLVRTYLADAAEQLQAVEAAVAAADASALVRPAHTLKSASFTVGAMRLGEAARALEQRGRAANLEGAGTDVAAALAAWHAAEEALGAWLARHE